MPEQWKTYQYSKTIRRLDFEQENGDPCTLQSNTLEDTGIVLWIKEGHIILTPDQLRRLLPYLWAIDQTGELPLGEEKGEEEGEERPSIQDQIDMLESATAILCNPHVQNRFGDSAGIMFDALETHREKLERLQKEQD